MAKQIQIQRGSLNQIAPHFKEKEFYSTSYDAPAAHPFYQELVDAAEYLRNHYGVPWRITSTYRTSRHELKICRDMGKGEEYAQKLAKTSQHVTGHAFDSQPVENHAEIVSDLAYQFTTRGEVFKALRKLGITGFGLYDWGVHLDCRPNPTTKVDGVYSFWDDREEVKAVKKKPVTTTPNQTKTPALRPKKVASPAS